MVNLFRRLRRTASKPLLFGLYGALGCLIAALLLGEPLLALTKLPPSKEKIPQAVALLIDTSGSMDSGKLGEVKQAAKNFVQRQTSEENEFAVIGFGSDTQVGTTLTQNSAQIQEAITNLADGGGTAMELGINAAMQELQSTSLAKNILLFTDGAPDSASNALQSAQQVKDQNVNLIAVATGDALVDFLAQLTGDSDLVFYASSGNFDQAFQEAEKVIYSEQLVESSPSGDYGLVYSALRIGGWTSLLAIGTALALIIGQNHYLRRRLLNLNQGMLGTGGAIAAGLVAGAIGQLIYTPLAEIPTISFLARLSGWTILGMLLGGGMSFIIPNLRRDRALLGGAMGGILGSLGFIAAASVTDDVIGRLVGAILIGFFIGLMVALIEQLSRNAWLVVRWTPKENTQISLGKDPITLGCADSDHLYLRQDQGYIPHTAKIFTEDSKVVMEYNPEYGEMKGMKKLRHELKDGDKRKLGGITLEVKTNPDHKSLRHD
jgi:Ca-activated chloride channel family protein